jgi:hypothetical protein
MQAAASAEARDSNGSAFARLSMLSPLNVRSVQGDMTAAAAGRNPACRATLAASSSSTSASPDPGQDVHGDHVNLASLR